MPVYALQYPWGMLLAHSFDFSIPPFDRLSEQECAQLNNALDIGYYPKDKVILDPGQQPDCLYILIKGLVKQRDETGETVGVYARHDAFDAMSLLEGQCKYQFIVHEECLCYLLPRELFLQLTQSNKVFEQFYFQSLLEKLETQASYDDTRRMAATMVAKVSQVYLHPPLIVDDLTSIRQASIMMQQQHATSLLVKRGEALGLFSSMDLRDAMVLGLGPDDAVGEVASFELISIDADDFLFNAQLIMTRHCIRRLVVFDKQQLLGVLELADLLSFMSGHSHTVMQQLDRAKSVNDLQQASERFLQLVQVLHGSGMKIPFVTALITELNRKLFRRLFELLAPKELIDNSCLIVMGSEGRGEQILRTDQDNALILRDEQLDYAMVTQVCTQFTQTLLSFGYPPCPGNMMISNPEWVKSINAFRHELYQALQTPDEASHIRLAAFIDAAAVCGDEALLQELKAYLYEHVQNNDAFFAHFARAALEFETPLGLFHQFLTHKQQDAEQLDIKKGGIFSIVHGLRSLAFELHIPEVNSFDRIDALVKLKILNNEFASELTQALQFLFKLRLDVVLEQQLVGEHLHNDVDIHKLNKLERDSLKESLLIVKEFKSILSNHFHLGSF